jgi:lipopolysaccharide export system protein LptA
MLKQDQPVKVTSNRLAYDGVAEATYGGNVMLWQENGSRIAADTVILNDNTGNLTARANVRTTMMLNDEDPKTKVRKPAETRASADTLVYDDAKRVATYTSAAPATARLTNVQGDMSGHRIDLFLKESGGELERIEADSTVSVKLEKLYAVGKHLVYTTANDTYVLTGDPVVGIQKDSQGACKQTDGNTMTYRRRDDSLLVEGLSGLANLPRGTSKLNGDPAHPRPHEVVQRADSREGRQPRNRVRRSGRTAWAQWRRQNHDVLNGGGSHRTGLGTRPARWCRRH